MTKTDEIYQAMKDILPKYPEGLRPRDLTNLIINEKRSDAQPHSIGSGISRVNDDHPDEFYKEKVKGGVVYFSRKSNASKSSRSIFVPMTTLAFSSKKSVIKSDSVMTKETSKSKIIAAAEEVLSLKKYSNGLSWGKLFPLVEAKLKDSNIPRNTIWGGVSTILTTAPDKFINKAKRGEKYVYAINNAKKSSTKKKGSKASKSKTAPKTSKYPEDAYYQPFANYLMNGESKAHPECTKAIPLGGKVFGGKWETPDVVGVFRAQNNEVVPFPSEIISAEIKKDSSDLITAFGQACAYRLFSHKTYIVIPDSGDIVNIERLCQIFGIGLVYFDPSEAPNESMFSLKLPAQKHSPDMFYVNQKIAIVAKKLELL